ncbi:MAG: hypothetical protein IJW76_01195 [Clostridia bacterium]|nr:hypothetical protein [Clostridia bacterium]
MTDSIFIGVAQTVLLIVLFYMYILFTAYLFPKKYLSPIFLPNKMDRGIKKYTFSGGRSVAYQPGLEFQKYISQYILYTEAEKKYIKCRISNDIRNIKYSLALFDRKDRFMGFLEVQENTAENGYTSAVLLPEETSYVQLTVCELNSVAVAQTSPVVYSIKNVIIYTAITVLFNMLSALIFGIAINDLFRIFVSDYYYYSVFNPAMIVFIGLLFGIIVSIAMALVYLNGNARFIMPKKEKKKTK